MYVCMYVCVCLLATPLPPTPFVGDVDRLSGRCAAKVASGLSGGTAIAFA